MSSSSSQPLSFSIPLIQRCLLFANPPSSFSIKRIVEFAHVNSAFDECVFRYGTARLLWDSHEEVKVAQIQEECFGGGFFDDDDDEDSADDKNDENTKKQNDPDFIRALQFCCLTPRSIHYTGRLRAFLIKYSGKLPKLTELKGVSPLSSTLSLKKKKNNKDSSEEEKEEDLYLSI